MKEWQKEMINIVMDDNDNIAETIAEIITRVYSDADIYMDELANEIYLQDSAKSEELKDDLENIIEIQEGEI